MRYPRTNVSPLSIRTELSGGSISGRICYGRSIRKHIAFRRTKCRRRMSSRGQQLLHAESSTTIRPTLTFRPWMPRVKSGLPHRQDVSGSRICPAGRAMSWSTCRRRRIGGPACPLRGTKAPIIGSLCTSIPSVKHSCRIDTAYGTNHLQFDSRGRLWTSGDSVGLGMFDPSLLDPEKPRETAPRAQKVFVSIDPRTGSSVAGGGYGITVSPLDGTVWRTNTYIGQSGAADTNALAGQNKIVKFDPKSSTFTQYPVPPPGRS